MYVSAETHRNLHTCSLLLRFFAVFVLCCISCIEKNACAAALDLDVALQNTYRACVGIDDSLSELKKLAGINTAVTAVGTATGASATIVGLVKASKDKRIEELKKKLEPEDINYIVGGQNRVHSGRTIIGFMDDSDFVAAGKRGFGGAHNGLDGDDVHMFRYLNGRMDNFEEGIGVVVHENTHGFQNLGRTAITEQGLPYKSVNYRGDGSKQYSNQLIEVEARFVQEKVKEGFLRELLR